ncbi:transcriptional repressor, partial [Streptomyces niveus]|uniref:Fur family transcriptional regulator n=1 Tax=Streptomyces niveus TaxID=193462 RepID=UPI00342EC380
MTTAPGGGASTAPVRGRSTRQRAAVAAALDEVDEFRSAQELHDMLKHRGDSVGLTTVYRTLQSLVERLHPGDGLFAVGLGLRGVLTDAVDGPEVAG